MNLSDAVNILRAHNEWRRGGERTQNDPHEIGLAIDTVCAALAKREAAPFAYVAINDGKIVAADRDDEVIFYAIAGGLKCDGRIYPAYLGEVRKP